MKNTVYLLSVAIAATLLVNAASAAVVVCADGTGDFKSVQEAVNAAPSNDKQPFVIQIKPGVYKGHIVVPADKPFLTFRGEAGSLTVLTDDKTIAALDPHGNKLGTPNSATVFILGRDFTAENITFENSAGNVGQALAVYASADRGRFQGCRFLGWQDTVRVENGRHYFADCYLAGHCDFIYGNATAFFDRCEVHCRADGFITAASTPETNRFGFVFRDCRVTAEPTVKCTFLGWPWRSFANVIFLKTDLPAGIAPAGWDNWRDPSRETTARFAEFRSRGPGANPTKRVKWSRQLSDAEAAVITVETVLRGDDGWNPQVQR